MSRKFEVREMNSRNKDVIDFQKKILIESYRKYVIENQSVALVDFPDHPNVGDSAIWDGEVKIFKEMSVRIGYTCIYSNYNASRLRALVPSGPIFIHGGGNFGDLWPEHQKLRLRLMEDFPDRVIVQLPQSIKFNDVEWIDRTAASIQKHGNFHLMVRDSRSQIFAKERLGVDAQLVPDSAFAIGALVRPIQADHDYMALMRTDLEVVERSKVPFQRVESIIVDDWLRDNSNFGVYKKLYRIFSHLYGAVTNRNSTFIYYNCIAKNRISRGVKLLSRGRVVITDRLHAHILSTLLDIPHVALDNHYGKIGGYIEAWTNSYPALKVADDLDEAVDLANDLLSRN